MNNSSQNLHEFTNPYGLGRSLALLVNVDSPSVCSSIATAITKKTQITNPVKGGNVSTIFFSYPGNVKLVRFMVNAVFSELGANVVSFI